MKFNIGDRVDAVDWIGVYNGTPGTIIEISGAGPKRNKQMVDSKPDIVLAFPLGESKGTRGTMKMALAAVIPVKQLGE